MSMQNILDNTEVIYKVSYKDHEEIETTNVGQLLSSYNCYTLGTLFMAYGKSILGPTKSWRFKAIYDKLASGTSISEIEQRDFDSLIDEIIQNVASCQSIIEVSNGWLIDDAYGGTDFCPENCGNEPWIVHLSNPDTDGSFTEFDREFEKGYANMVNCVLDFPRYLCDSRPIVDDYYLI